jgi:hypothetical protein
VFLVVYSAAGKAPIAEEHDAASAAKLAAADGSSSSSMTFTQKLGQWLGLIQAEGTGIAREVLPRQWRPVLHPAFTIAGTQPTVVIPQVGLAAHEVKWVLPVDFVSLAPKCADLCLYSH